MFSYKIINAHIKTRTIVFIHGFLESQTMWNVLELQKFNFCSITIDLPGHGKSNLLDLNPSIIYVAANLKFQLNKLGYFEFDVLGHSLGGYVAIELHKLNFSFGKICLLNSNFWEDDAKKKTDRNRVIELVKISKHLFIREAIPNLFLEHIRNNHFVSDLVQEALQISVESIVFYTKAMRDRPSNIDYISNLTYKAMIIQGNLDKIVIKNSMISFKQLIDLQIIHECGHMSHFEQTKKIQEILNFF